MSRRVRSLSPAQVELLTFLRNGPMHVRLTARRTLAVLQREGLVDVNKRGRARLTEAGVRRLP